MRKRVAGGTGKRWLLENQGHRGDACLIWPFGCSTPGYGMFEDNKMNHGAHRFMCQLVHGDPPSPQHHATHSCGNRRCVNPSHLSWATPSQNQIDRRKQGSRTARLTKLSPEKVEQIRQLKGKETSIKTAAKYGVTESNVRLIQYGKTWKQNPKLIRWTAEEDAEIWTGIAAGMTSWQTAERLGRSQKSVEMRLMRLRRASPRI